MYQPGRKRRSVCCSVRESRQPHFQSLASSWPALCSQVDVDGRRTQWTNGLSLCLQIIRLINVFTPQKSLEEFQDL